MDFGAVWDSTGIVFWVGMGKDYRSDNPYLKKDHNIYDNYTAPIDFNTFIAFAVWELLREWIEEIRMEIPSDSIREDTKISLNHSLEQ